MRYSKITRQLETPKKPPRRSAGKWYDLHEFLELKDVDESDRRAPRSPLTRRIDPLASGSDYVPHSLGQELPEDDGDQ